MYFMNKKQKRDYNIIVFFEKIATKKFIFIILRLCWLTVGIVYSNKDRWRIVEKTKKTRKNEKKAGMKIRLISILFH